MSEETGSRGDLASGRRDYESLQGVGPTHDGEVAGPGLRWRHSAPDLLPSPDPLQGVRPVAYGSCFWALQGEESSDEEEGEVTSCASGTSILASEFLHEALLAGFSVDQVRREEALSADGVSSSFGSVSLGAG